MQKLTPEWEAILHLQNKAAQFSTDPTSFDFQTYDHAVGLAIERLNDDPNFLAHNAYRHAKTTIRRRKLNAPEELNNCFEIEQLLDEKPVLAHQHEQQNLFIRLLHLAREAGQKVLACVLHWFDGLTVAESAISLQMTPFAVKKIRQRFKARVKAELGEWEA